MSDLMLPGIGHNGGPPLDDQPPGLPVETPAQALRLQDLAGEARVLLANPPKTAAEAVKAAVLVKQITLATDDAEAACKKAVAPLKAEIEAVTARYSGPKEDAAKEKARLLALLKKLMEGEGIEDGLKCPLTGVLAYWRNTTAKGAKPAIADPDEFCARYPWLTKTIPDMEAIQAELDAGKTLDGVEPPPPTGRAVSVR